MRSLTSEELDLVVGGCEEEEKCNNGWGNGPDCTNNGSFSGKGPFGEFGAKDINGIGAWDKFEGR